MGKIQRQPTESIKTKQQEFLKKRKSGRPINREIQSLFINGLRQSKLQAINAEAQLQIQIAFFSNDQDKKSRKKSQSSVSDKWVKIYEFTALNSQNKNKLHQNFDECQKQWTFQQIQQEQDLQTLFFDDQNDLAFILHHIIRNRKNDIENTNFLQNQHNQIKAQELFYLCLLSLNSRQNLRDVVLEFFLKNQNLIVNILWASMEKAREKYSKRIKRNNQNSKGMEESENIQIAKQSQLAQEESICDQSQFSRVQTHKKGIKKSLKKQNRQYSLDSDDSQEPMSQKEKEEKLILCFVNYISWSYFYILGEEEKLEKELEMQ